MIRWLEKYNQREREKGIFLKHGIEHDDWARRVGHFWERERAKGSPKELMEEQQN
jgi:hypothetical protein